MTCRILLALLAIGIFSLPREIAGERLALIPAAYAQDKPSVEAPVEEEDEAADEDEDSESADDNFIPTEKINVDSSVSFPVDI